jgi:O-antigen/teichoic acid export membrane protein
VGTGRNVAAGFAGATWSALLSLAVVPFYLRYLGHEAFGLVGVLVTVQGLLAVLDAGLSQTMNREMARALGADRTATTANLLRSMEYIYWIAALIAGCALALGSAAIAGNWLHVEALPAETVRDTLILIGAVVACRLPVGLYIGALSGAQKLTTVNAVNAVAATLTSFGGVWLAAASGSVEVLMAWQAVAGLLHALTLRTLAWRIPGKETPRRFDKAALSSVAAFGWGSALITLLGIALTQTDKILLSRMLSLADFGYYAMAGSAAARMLQLVASPLFSAVFPHFSSLVASNRSSQLAHNYRLGSCALAGVLFPGAAVLVVFSEYLIRLWTGDAGIAEKLGPTLAWMSVGYAINGVMNVPYALQLAFGNTRLPLAISAIVAIIALPLTVLLTVKLGMVGGALAGAVMNVIYLFLGAWLTHRHILTGLAPRWLAIDIGKPLVISAAVGSIAWVLGASRLPGLLPLGAAVLTGAVASGVIVITSSDLRALRLRAFR